MTESLADRDLSKEQQGVPVVLEDIKEICLEEFYEQTQPDSLIDWEAPPVPCMFSVFHSAWQTVYFSSRTRYKLKSQSVFAMLFALLIIRCTFVHQLRLTTTLQHTSRIINVIEPLIFFTYKNDLSVAFRFEILCSVSTISEDFAISAWPCSFTF